MSSPNLKPIDKVVVSCVTFETAKIVDPIIHLRADRAYLLHYSTEESKERGDIYTAFYSEVVRQLKKRAKMDDWSIKEVVVKVFLFKEVLAALLEILHRERTEDNIVYVNISAGTMEYAAASTLASMMVPGVKPIAVGVEKFLIPPEKVREVYFKDGNPVGMALSVLQPKELPTYPIEMPPSDLVRALRTLRLKIDSRHITSYPKMIAALKEEGIWNYEGAVGQGKNVAQAEKMYYSRHFVNSWLERGWVRKEGRGKLALTEAGLNVCDIFHRTDDATE